MKELELFQSFAIAILKMYPTISKCYLRHTYQQGFLLQQKREFKVLRDKNENNLKLRSITEQTGTCQYKTGKVVSQYLKLLTKKELVINNTQDFSSMLNNLTISKDEGMSESLFSNIPIKNTKDFICEEIYLHKKFGLIWKKSISRITTLLSKLTIVCTFSATRKLCRQVDSVSIEDTLSVTFSDCFMNKMERDVALQLKQKFYRQFVDGRYRKKRKINKIELFSKTNSYHPSINLTIETNLLKVLGTKVTRNKNAIKCLSTIKITSYLFMGHLLCKETTKRMP